MNPQIEIADTLFSRLARISRADSTGAVVCICCGKPSHWATMDCAHFVGRSCTALRWDLSNGWPCHRVCHSDPNHQVNYETALIKAQGEAFVEELKFKGKQFGRAPGQGELEALIESLIIKLRQYANQNGTRYADLPEGDAAV